ncbi:MAG: polymer-forming cytoskeletal protein [Nitrospira defluvii]|nr:polymer-forming cytoskeletal protein [Nitrospira defluvii]
MTPVIFFISMGWFAFSTIAFADDPSPKTPLSERAVLRAGQVIQGDYFAVGPHVEISGIVNGDLYAAGGEVLVDGTVNGDVIVAGGKVILSGTVAQDARIAGAQVTISGTIGRNATIGGADVHLTETAQVRENLLAGGGNVQLAGHIGKDARIGAAKVTVSNEIERDLAVAAESVRLTSKATVGGKLRYWSETAPSIDEGATVRGAITRRLLPEGWTVESARRGILGMRVMATVVSFLSTLILGLVLLRVYPLFTRRVTATIRERPGSSLGWGTVALVAIPIVAVSFLVTLFALPIGVILLALYVPMVYLARVYAITCLGQFLLRRQSDPSSLAWPFVAGLVLYSMLSLIPVVGGLLTLLTLLFGLGALLMTKQELIATLREQNQV